MVHTVYNVYNMYMMHVYVHNAKKDETFKITRFTCKEQSTMKFTLISSRANIFDSGKLKYLGN